MDTESQDELPEDLKEELDTATEFIQHYTKCVFMTDGRYAHFENARDFYLGFRWPSQAQFDELVEALYWIASCDAVCGSPFDSRIIYEIGKVRSRTVGGFKPDLQFLVTPFGRGSDSYDSAFQFVSQLLYATDLVLRSCDLRAIFGVEAFDELELAHAEPEFPTNAIESEDLLGDVAPGEELDAHAHEAIAYYAGLANALPVFDSHKLLAELRREAHAVSEFRQTHESWLSKGTSSGELWSEPRSPAEWAKAFNVHRDTFLARVREGKIRAKKLTSKSYRVHKDDLPTGLR
jgi:excisionase family DNA binding protein